MKMYFYIAESDKKSLFTTTLIKRCESYEEAAAFCAKAASEWRSEGLNAFLCYDKDIRHNPDLVEGAKVVGCEALDEEYIVVHNYHIFATPCFMAGGSIG